MDSSTTTTLSISSKEIKNCNDVALYLKKCGVPCDITSNQTVMKNNGKFYVENGCRIILNNKNKIINKSLWNDLKDVFKLDCAHIKVDGQFKGCINDYLRKSDCPGLK